jgi:hypothetical protein
MAARYVRKIDAPMKNDQLSLGRRRAFRIEFLNQGHVDTEAAYSAGEFTYDLRALEAASGREVAAASCTVKEDGQVVVMRFEPRAVVALSFASRL